MISGNPRLERLQLTAFRGATRPTAFQFQGDRPLILIFGENGAGKSTLADAIDFLCNNDFGSLALKSGGPPAGLRRRAALPAGRQLAGPAPVLRVLPRG
jgi:predicted ATPase